MSNIEVVTNNIPRPLVPRYALPKKVRKDFDYVKKWDATPRFVKYRGEWYDAIDTQRISTSHVIGRMGWDYRVEPDHPFAKWDAIMSDTFFSGVLFRFTDGDNDEDMVVVGRYCA